MSITKEKVKTFDPPDTPEEIIDNITDECTPDHHRVNLSAMLIAWLRQNDGAADAIKQDVYYTFHTLNSALKEIAHYIDRKEEWPCTN